MCIGRHQGSDPSPSKRRRKPHGFSRATLTKGHPKEVPQSGWLNNGNVLSPRSGGCTSKTKGWAGLAPSALLGGSTSSPSLSSACRWLSPLCVSLHCLSSPHLSVPVSKFPVTQDPGPPSHPHQPARLCEGPVSKKLALEVRELRTPAHHREGRNSVPNGKHR